LKSPFTDVYTPCLQSNYGQKGFNRQPDFLIPSFYYAGDSITLELGCNPSPRYCIYSI
jgi:hypothetical protein